MDELERKAKHCMNHYHGCDCREWHHQQQLNICDRRIEAHTSYINELETELATTQDELRRAKELIKGGLETQNKYYGYATDLHIYMIGWAEDAKAFLTPAQLQAREEECCGVGFVLSDNHTHWNCGQCGKQWPMLVTPVEQESERVMVRLDFIKKVLSLTLAASDWGLRLDIPALHDEAQSLNESIFADETLEAALTGRETKS
jgi:hypothetical protein